MKLIHPAVSLMHYTTTPALVVELAGRTCYKSEANITRDSAAAFVKARRGQHEAVLEHAHATVRIVCDRGVSHELVRHRIASFCQESTRYCTYATKPMEFIIPPWVDLSAGYYDPLVAAEFTKDGTPERQWIMTMLCAEWSYVSAVGGGWTPQQARSVLPNSLKTEVVMTANMREWRTVFGLRLAKAAHPQMRQVMRMVYETLVGCEPMAMFFDDIDIETGEVKA